MEGGDGMSYDDDITWPNSAIEASLPPVKKDREEIEGHKIQPGYRLGFGPITLTVIATRTVPPQDVIDRGLSTSVKWKEIKTTAGFWRLVSSRDRFEKVNR